MNKNDSCKNIELLNIIGKGSYGNVYLGRNESNNQFYAIKVISKSQLKSRIVYQYFNNEIYILKHLDHPNIVKYINLVEKKNDYWLIIEYCNGESFATALKYNLKKFNRPLPEKVVRYFILCVLKAIIYLNHQNIIHRDIKSDNILLHYENENDLISNNFIKAQVKLIDFGFARYLDNNELAGSLVGTPMYMDPNVLKTFLESKTRVVQGFYDQKVDVWSLGILTYELLIGIVPFMSKDIKGLFQNVNERDFYIPKEEKRNFVLTENAIKFIDKTLNIDANVRPLPSELINDPWFSDDYENDRIFQMKTDDEIKYLKNKKYFINFWKPKEDNKIAFDESIAHKKNYFASMKTINYNNEEKKKKLLKHSKNNHYFTLTTKDEENEEESVHNNPKAKKEERKYSQEKSNTFFTGASKKKYIKKNMTNLTSHKILNDSGQKRFYTENENEPYKDMNNYSNYNNNNKENRIIKNCKISYNTANSKNKKKTIKIKSVNYISSTNDDPNNKKKEKVYFKYVSPLKKKDCELNFKPKVLSNTFLYRKKNSFSDSFRKEKKHFSNYSRGHYTNNNNYMDEDSDN